MGNFESGCIDYRDWRAAIPACLSLRWKVFAQEAGMLGRGVIQLNLSCKNLHRDGGCGCAICVADSVAGGAWTPARVSCAHYWQWLRGEPPACQHTHGAGWERCGRVPGQEWERGVQLCRAAEGQRSRGGESARCFAGSASEQGEKRPRQVAESSDNANTEVKTQWKQAGQGVQWTPSSSATPTPHEGIFQAASRHVKILMAHGSADATRGCRFCRRCARCMLSCWGCRGKER